MAKNTFTLSANIENGIIEGSKYIVTPNVQKVLQEILNGYHTGIHSFSIIGTYGTGKSSFLLQIEKDLIESKKRSLLKNPKVLHEGQFEILNILGDAKPLSKILLSKIQEITGFTEENDVLKLLKVYYEMLKKQNKFLLIAIDEFGKNLEYAAKNNPEEELYFMQKLCELVNVPTRNILLLTTLHQNFSAYSRKLSTEQKNEWTKVKGRFQEVVFAEPIEQLLFLAAEHISSDNKNIIDENFLNIYNLAIERKFVSSDFSFETASKLYPIDTFAAYAVTRAIQKYGQNERSLFSF